MKEQGQFTNSLTYLQWQFSGAPDAGRHPCALGFGNNQDNVYGAGRAANA